ncbi:hypothetical protein [Cyanobium sp. LEGE 06143]|uniref:hypothetical protein n=1 Tax=Cyanobium sp. LEGE 06143 TaxID=945727 RepID=UPI001D14564A|nr:hypothetical protein [Cyanobium sp. LEGE 06143]
MPKLELEGVARREARRWLIDLDRLPETWPAVVRARRDSFQPEPGTTPRAVSLARKLAAQAAMAELELEERRAELVNVVEVEALWRRCAGRVRVPMEVLPAQITERIAVAVGGLEADRRRAMEALLEGEVAQALSAID